MVRRVVLAAGLFLTVSFQPLRSDKIGCGIFYCFDGEDIEGAVLHGHAGTQHPEFWGGQNFTFAHNHTSYLYLNWHDWFYPGLYMEGGGGNHAHNNCTEN